MKVDAVARWSSLAAWAAAAASLVYWSLRLAAPVTPTPPHAVSVADGQALRGDPLRVLGEATDAPAAVPVVAAAPSRFKLLGVVAPRAPQAAAEGLAVIAIDSKPAKAYRVGAVVEGDLVLQRVHQRGAELGARGARTPAVALDLPRQAAASTGTLPSLARPAALPTTQALPTVQPTPAPQAVPAQGLPEVDGEPDRLPSDEPPRPAVQGRQGAPAY